MTLLDLDTETIDIVIAMVYWNSPVITRFSATSKSINSMVKNFATAKCIKAGRVETPNPLRISSVMWTSSNRILKMKSIDVVPCTKVKHVTCVPGEGDDKTKDFVVIVTDCCVTSYNLIDVVNVSQKSKLQDFGDMTSSSFTLDISSDLPIGESTMPFSHGGDWYTILGNRLLLVEKSRGIPTNRISILSNWGEIACHQHFLLSNSEDAADMLYSVCKDSGHIVVVMKFPPLYDLEIDEDVEVSSNVLVFKVHDNNSISMTHLMEFEDSVVFNVATSNGNVILQSMMGGISVVDLTTGEDICVITGGILTRMDSSVYLNDKSTLLVKYGNAEYDEDYIIGVWENGNYQGILRTNTGSFLLNVTKNTRNGSVDPAVVGEYYTTSVVTKPLCSPPIGDIINSSFDIVSRDTVCVLEPFPGHNMKLHRGEGDKFIVHTESSAFRTYLQDKSTYHKYISKNSGYLVYCVGKTTINKLWIYE